MIKLKRIIAPVDDTPFDEICSFETNNYIGVFVDCLPKVLEPGFVVMPKNDGEFSIDFITIPETLEQLDNTLYYKVKEHIACVSTSRELDIKIIE